MLIKSYLRHFIVILILVVLFDGRLTAQSYNSIKGRVVDKRTDKPLVNVNVFLKDTFFGTTTDNDGMYEIEKIQLGEYEIVVDIIGYKKIIKGPFRITFREELEMNFSLTERDIYFNEPVTITATRGKSIATEVLASVDVITSEMIELQNPDNVADAIDAVQGVNIRDYGGLGGLKTISIRGSTSSQVLVMLDGQRINNAQIGQVDLSTISVEGIEKIEVVRGGNSAIYGADAVGGVVNIITKKHSRVEGFNGNISAMQGSFDFHSYKADVAYRSRGNSGSVTVKRITSKGDFKYSNRFGNEMKRENSDLMSYNIFSKLRHEFGDPHSQKSMELSYKFINSKKGTPGGIDAPYFKARTEESNQQLNYTYSGKLLNMMNDFKLQGYLHSNNFRYDNEEISVLIHSLFKNRAYGGEGQMRTVINENSVVTYGIGGRYDWLSANNFPDIKTRTTYNLFLLNELIFPLDEMTLLNSVYFVSAIRYDGSNDFGNRISPKAGAALKFGEDWQTSLKINIGRSYRAPGFNDLYWPEDAFAVGNIDLLAESGSNWDAGFRLQYPILNGLYLESTYFANNMKDLILWQQTTVVTEDGSSKLLWTPLNVTKTKSEGVETNFSINLIPRILTLSANYTYLNARNLSEVELLKNKLLVYSPKHTINGSMMLKLRSVTVFYKYNYTDKVFATRSNTISLRRYIVSDATIAYKIAKQNRGMKITFQMRNIFDEEYQVIRHHPTPGREYRITFGLDFK